MRNYPSRLQSDSKSYCFKCADCHSAPTSDIINHCLQEFHLSNAAPVRRGPRNARSKIPSMPETVEQQGTAGGDSVPKVTAEGTLRASVSSADLGLFKGVTEARQIFPENLFVLSLEKKSHSLHNCYKQGKEHCPAVQISDSLITAWPCRCCFGTAGSAEGEHWFVSVLAQGWHCPVTSPTLCWNLALWQGVESASYPAESELLLTKHPWGQAALTPHATDCSAGGFISWGTCQRHGQPCRMAPALCAHRTQVPSLLLWNKTRHGRGKHELITGSHKFRYCRYMRYL